jgi:hypothetical protein
MPLPAATLDFDALARAQGVDLDDAFAGLLGLYVEVDRRNAANTGGLELPCARGCDACCHESVFLTPLELYAAWEWLQEHYDPPARLRVIERGLAAYADHRERILALSAPPPAGARDHFAIAREVRFRCPLLADDGACMVYPVRELYARLFGQSFNEEGGVYGCDLVGQHLGGRTVTLLRVRAVAEALNALPLTASRNVYPHYIHSLFGG